MIEQNIEELQQLVESQEEQIVWLRREVEELMWNIEEFKDYRGVQDQRIKRLYDYLEDSIKAGKLQKTI